MNIDIEKIKKTIASTFEIPVETVNSHSSSQTIEQWDSMGHINLVMALEQRFGVKFTMDEIMKLRNFASLCQVMEGKMAATKAM